MLNGCMDPSWFRGWGNEILHNFLEHTSSLLTPPLTPARQWDGETLAASCRPFLPLAPSPRCPRVQQGKARPSSVVRGEPGGGHLVPLREGSTWAIFRVGVWCGRAP
jgi:hypothetical protein